MKRLSIALIAAAALGLAGWSGFQSISGTASDGLPDTPEEWQGRIDYVALDRQISALTKRPEMAGLAVAIVEKGELRFVRTYGFADRSTGARVTADTIFRWTSVSKTATGILAAKLAEEGVIDLESPLASWKTSLRLPGRAETKLSFAQLLSHQTGLTKYAYDEKLEDGEDPQALRGKLADAPLQCFPGTCHTYQNIAFDAAREILEQAAQKPFPDSVQARFFRPLGMASANCGMAGLTGAKSWARPYTFGESREVKEAYWRVPAAAGVNSNIVDLGRWMQAMMGERPDVVPRPVLQRVQTPRTETPEMYSGRLADALTNHSYGLGVRSFTYAGHRLVGHSGAVSGYRATMIFDPATRTGIVAMWNSNWGAPFRIPFAVLDSYYRRKDSPWLDLSDIPLPVPEPAPNTDTLRASKVPRK